MKNVTKYLLIESLDSLLMNVSLMRAWQKKYFRKRSHEALSKSFFYESMVDCDLLKIIDDCYEDEERPSSRAKSKGLWPSE